MDYRKSRIILFLTCLFLFCSCGGSVSSASNVKDEVIGDAGNEESLDGIYYLYDVIFTNDKNSLIDSREAPKIGSEDSSLTISGDRIEFDYYFHREKESSKAGSIKEESNISDVENVGNESLVLFEGDGNQYYLSTIMDEKNCIQKVYLRRVMGDGYSMRYCFTPDKLDQYDGELEEINLNDKTPFEESAVYAVMKEEVESKIDQVEVSYDSVSSLVRITYYAPDGLYDKMPLISESDTDLVSSINTICSALLKLSLSGKKAVDATGYTEVSVMARLVDRSVENGVICSYVDGDEVYRKQYGTGLVDNSNSGNSNSSNSSNSSSNTDDTKSDFENSESYKNIKSICMREFSDNNPRFSYDRKNKTFTLTLTCAKGVHKAIDEDAKKVIEAWIGWCYYLAEVSASGYQIMCDDGYSDICFIIMVCSDIDSSKCMYATLNGYDQYNILYEY